MGMTVKGGRKGCGAEEKVKSAEMIGFNGKSLDLLRGDVANTLSTCNGLNWQAASSTVVCVRGKRSRREGTSSNVR